MDKTSCTTVNMNIVIINIANLYVVKGNHHHRKGNIDKWRWFKWWEREVPHLCSSCVCVLKDTNWTIPLLFLIAPINPMIPMITNIAPLTTYMIIAVLSFFGIATDRYIQKGIESAFFESKMYLSCSHVVLGYVIEMLERVKVWRTSGNLTVVVVMKVVLYEAI